MDTDEQSTSPGVDVASDNGVLQTVDALRRTLNTTPVGWILVVWFCWGRVPQHQIGLWLGSFLAIWLACLGILHSVTGSGPVTRRHRPAVFSVACLDGLAWSLTTWFLMGRDPILDPVLIALLCGVGAINAPVYVTFIRAYYLQIGTLWAVALLGLMNIENQPNILDYAIGLTVFLALMAYYMRGIAVRVVEGIRLQLTNASLTEQLRAALLLVKQDAATDALTGQGNRRSLDALLIKQMELADQIGIPFSVLMLDIDFFKSINDVHGHLIGDNTLRAFAARVREHLRQGDVCARFGGEEFVIVLPGTTLQTAMEVAERLRRGIADSDLLSEPAVRVTVSIGAATHNARQSVDELIQRADAAVYAAKRAGRNRVISSASATA